MRKSQDVNDIENDDFNATEIEKLSTKLSDDEELVIPDGGWGWLICCGTFVVNFIVFGIHNSFGVVYANLLDELKIGEAETGLYKKFIFYKTQHVCIPGSQLKNSHFSSRNKIIQ